jgi:hypothetical protein
MWIVLNLIVIGLEKLQAYYKKQNPEEQNPEDIIASVMEENEPLLIIAKFMMHVSRVQMLVIAREKSPLLDQSEEYKLQMVFGSIEPQHYDGGLQSECEKLESFMAALKGSAITESNKEFCIQYLTMLKESRVEKYNHGKKWSIISGITALAFGIVTAVDFTIHNIRCVFYSVPPWYFVVQVALGVLTLSFTITTVMALVFTLGTKDINKTLNSCIDNCLGLGMLRDDMPEISSQDGSMTDELTDDSHEEPNQNVLGYTLS